jgi:hypothetical protein
MEEDVLRRSGACEKVAEDGGPPEPNPRVWRFNLFFRLQSPKRPESLQRRLLLTFSTSTLTNPPFLRGTYLAP